MVGHCEGLSLEPELCPTSSCSVTTGGDLPPSQERRAASRGHVSDRLAELQRRGERERRYSSLNQINKNNASRPRRQMDVRLPNTSNLQVTPVVADGVMYVSNAPTNVTRSMPEPDAKSGHLPAAANQRGSSACRLVALNRGVAVAGDRVFATTDHAHLTAPNRATGALMWEIEMADWHQNYYHDGSPLAL